MIQATQLRRGNTIIHNNELYQVVDYQHITPGNWRGMVQTKLRNMRTGSIIFPAQWDPKLGIHVT